MLAFSYPKTKSVRGADPGPFGHYSGYKPHLRSLFRRRCVYCRKPDVTGIEGFGVDHHRPKNEYVRKRDADAWENLLYSCNPCNRRKGQYWPTAQQKSFGAYFPNPCAEAMWDHLRYSGPKVIANSVVGTFVEDRARSER